MQPPSSWCGVNTAKPKGCDESNSAHEDVEDVYELNQLIYFVVEEHFRGLQKYPHDLFVACDGGIGAQRLVNSAPGEHALPIYLMYCHKREVERPIQCD